MIFLNKCKDCGSDDVQKFSELEGNRWVKYVECMNCYRQTSRYDRIEDAIKEWNQ